MLEIDLLALLVSAVCHDLEHPGLTNGFQIATESPLARRYNDIKVLENHHASVAFDILSESQLFGHFSQADRRTLRKTIVEAILSTDMSTHKELVGRVKTRLNERQLLNNESDPDRQLLVSFLMHCADLCNPTLPHWMSVRIAESLGEEFEGQAAKEREMGHPVSVMLAPTVLKKSEMETGFIQFVVMPLYSVLAKIAPDLITFVDRVESNLEMWSEMRDTHNVAAPPGQNSGISFNGGIRSKHNSSRASDSGRTSADHGTRASKRSSGAAFATLFAKAKPPPGQ